MIRLASDLRRGASAARPTRKHAVAGVAVGVHKHAAALGMTEQTRGEVPHRRVPEPALVNEAHAAGSEAYHLAHIGRVWLIG